jgi:hypothetical protein
LQARAVALAEFQTHARLEILSIDDRSVHNGSYHVRALADPERAFDDESRATLSHAIGKAAAKAMIEQNRRSASNDQTLQIDDRANVVKRLDLVRFAANGNHPK